MGGAEAPRDIGPRAARTAPPTCRPRTLSSRASCVRPRYHVKPLSLDDAAHASRGRRRRVPRLPQRRHRRDQRAATGARRRLGPDRAGALSPTAGACPTTPSVTVAVLLGSRAEALGLTARGPRRRRRARRGQSRARTSRRPASRSPASTSTSQPGRVLVLRRERGPLPRAPHAGRSAAIAVRTVARDMPCLLEHRLVAGAARGGRRLRAPPASRSLHTTALTGVTIARLTALLEDSLAERQMHPRRADGHPRPRRAHHRRERDRQERVRARPDRPRPPARRRRHRGGAPARGERASSAPAPSSRATTWSCAGSG